MTPLVIVSDVIYCSWHGCGCFYGHLKNVHFKFYSNDHMMNHPAMNNLWWSSVLWWTICVDEPSAVMNHPMITHPMMNRTWWWTNLLWIILLWTLCGDELPYDEPSMEMNHPIMNHPWWIVLDPLRVRAVKSCQRTHPCNRCRQHRLTVYT